MAQDGPILPTPEVEQEPDPGLIGQGLRRLFEGLLRDMEPALDEMGRALQELEPIARDLAELLGDVRHYDPPERLPNGDIIIRRKPGAPPPPDVPSAPQRPAPADPAPLEPPQIDL
ncbi:AAA+ family ATPase [Tabrizicola sp. DMG-N-6]|uniref:AAA+ family ATPase n=2 Tax=Szabonella alba TaxID=2804194 RepID=A0A8K0V943_9RHOB|nr:AAA+ family ATPase [Szabonella alba]